MKQKLLALLGCSVVLAVLSVEAINVGPLGAQGQGGTKNGQTFQIGSSGTVFELDSFLRIEGQDLNGNQVGIAAQLSRDPLPGGLAYSVASSPGADPSDWIFTYTISNATSGVFSNLTFLAVVDAELSEATNTFFNEFGSWIGVPAARPGDATQWQIDEPGFHGGALFQKLLSGKLSNSNSIPQSAPEDVALALGFERARLWPGNALRVRVMVSEAGHTLGQFGLLQQDVTDANTTVAVSGQADPGGISGTIYRDANTNRVADMGEGISNVVMVLEGPDGFSPLQLLTDAGGHYDFGRPPGSGPFTVRVTESSLPPGLTDTVDQPIPGTAFEATRTLGETNLVLNWGYSIPAQQFVDVSGELKMQFLRWQLNYATGTLKGTLALTNPATSTAVFSPPYQLAMHTATNFYYPFPSGTLASGLPYVDLSAAVTSLIPGGELAPGQGVVLTNAVEIYSLTRSAPPGSLFEIWAMRR
jgi:hypothetical protein